MSLPTEEEMESLAKFRERVGDILPKEQLEDDMFLIRWIRAREMNLDNAEDMLRKALKWRIENKVDNILDREMDPFIKDNYPRWIEGVDKKGQPIYTSAFGQWDLRKAINQDLVPQFLEYTTEGFERLLQAMKESNKRRRELFKDPPPVTQVIGIVDFNGFPWSQLINFRAVQGLLQLAVIYEAYYPEILNTCYFINCPSMISRLLALLKPVVAPKTMAKIKCFGTNKEEWQSELLRVVDADQLPSQYGGTLNLLIENCYS